MNNMKVTREKALRFIDSTEFDDILEAIQKHCGGVPARICVYERYIECRGNQKTKDPEAIQRIYFRELGYRDLNISMTKDGATYNELQLVALSLHEFFKIEQREQGLAFSFTYPVAEDVIGLPVKDGSAWSITFRKEQMPGEKSWVTYAVLGFFLGAFGLHNFYAGQKKKGIIKLLVTLTFIGSPFMEIWGMYEAYRAFENKKIMD